MANTASFHLNLSDNINNMAAVAGGYPGETPMPGGGRKKRKGKKAKGNKAKSMKARRGKARVSKRRSRSRSRSGGSNCASHSQPGGYGITKRGGSSCASHSQPGGGGKRRKATRRVSGKGRGRRTSMLRMKKRMSKRRGSKAKSRSRSRSSSLRRRSKASRKQRGGGCRAISNALPGTDKECLEHAIDETRCRFTPGCEFIR